MASEVINVYPPNMSNVQYVYSSILNTINLSTLANSHLYSKFYANLTANASLVLEGGTENLKDNIDRFLMIKNTGASTINITIPSHTGDPTPCTITPGDYALIQFQYINEFTKWIIAYSGILITE